MDTVFSTDISTEISLVKYNKSFNFLMFIIILIVFVIVVVPWDKLGLKKIENMSGGTLAQMFAQDSQDVYLKGNVDKIATTDFDLFWNQPTRQGMNTFQNRGYPLYSVLLPDTPMNPTPNMLEVSNNYVDNIINNEVHKKENKLTFPNPILTLENVLSSKNQIKPNVNSSTSKETKDYETVNGEEQDKTEYLSLPKATKATKATKSIKSTKTVPTLSASSLPSSLPINTVANSNPYELANAAKQVAKTKQTTDNLPKLTNWGPQDYLFQGYIDKAINDKNCLLNPASCTGFAGGARLPDGFVQSTKSVPYVNLDGNYFYPDSYVGSYWIEPNFDINKPYPVILNGDRV